MKAHQLTTIFIVILILILGIGIYLFYQYQGNADKQYTIALLLAMEYLVWGVVFHSIKGDFHLKIMVEYLVISLLAIIILRGLIYH
ncbi:hypothetical protein A2Y99_03695 [Candidatus Gottesmanbacteria bacterium RBG_13_37_7]|uniref:Uncharacterized protein n=1 Tax=Candidatus Gottesmanbacteria bacterium RBG_13_37_7 TaxID=1798369 RepID=A0A1F5YK55_9BACT|nr:MAG: hypothetical protein A2Y99_03695 [Candidatus Gottesmanbacteria bacterium RBG_13_37_7]